MIFDSQGAGDADTTPSLNDIRRAFKHQLSALMSRIGATRTHFVRTVNPNQEKQADDFDASHIMMQQIRGVLHAVTREIRLSRTIRAT